MGEPTGFMRYRRSSASRRSVKIRLKDWKEVYEPFSDKELSIQGARCMDCGIPFCHEGCPLGNLIPEWNDLVYRSKWDLAVERLHATNNFPDFTGRLCPAPCEGSCVLGINEDPVAIKELEVGIIEHLATSTSLPIMKPSVNSGKSVAIVGSGPSGLACAQQLCRGGHDVVVFERGEKPGGLLRYGIPEFKMEKWVLDRRLNQLEAEGVEFRVNTFVGVRDSHKYIVGDQFDYGVPENAWSPTCSEVSIDTLLGSFDAIILAGGSTVARDLDIPGRQLSGIYFAMEYLKPSNLVQEGLLVEPTITANGKDVVIIGGGDTGADCLGTALRQGAKSVLQLEILPKPSQERQEDNPWPTWPLIFRTSSAHEEGGKRIYSITALEFLEGEDSQVGSMALQEVKSEIVNGRAGFVNVEGSERTVSAQLVLLAMGFVGPEKSGPISQLNLELDSRGNVSVDSNWMTSKKGVFACGDVVRGQSLIVWAIAEGRSCARGVDSYLESSSELPSPIYPGQLAIR